MVALKKNYCFTTYTSGTKLRVIYWIVVAGSVFLFLEYHGDRILTASTTFTEDHLASALLISPGGSVSLQEQKLR